MDRSDIIDKVRALWAKADDPASTEPEREAFRVKAADLMAKYEIDNITLRASGSKVSDPLTVGNIRVERPNKKLLVPQQRMSLAHAIAKAFDCKGVIIDTPDGKFYQCVGYESDINMARELYFALATDMLTGILEDEDHNHTAGWKESFAEAFTMTVGFRLTQMHHRVDSMAKETGASTALAVVDKREKVSSFLESQHPSSRLKNVTRKSFVMNSDGAAKGTARGKAADLGGNRVSSNDRKAIG